MSEERYRGAAGLNYFEEDALLQRVLAQRLPASRRKAAFAELEALGALCGGRLGELVDAAHRDDRWPRLERYDRWGRRVDRVVYCEEQLQARRLAFEAGCLPPAPLLERMAKAYLLNQNGEGGITCPIAMTDGLVQLLEDEGTPQQKKRWLPLLRDVDTHPAFTAGQQATERQGGSNVSQNETTAEQAPDGTWRLTGLKWFCSNPGELWVATAKPKGADVVGLFLVPRHRPDGSLNECHILRLKDLSGTRGKATAEIEYKGAYAELIGRPIHGMSLLLRVLKTSRVHTACASLGFLRRALVEARLYARDRLVLGKPLERLPHAAESLARIEALWTASLLCFFDMLSRLDAGDKAADVLAPLLKISVSRCATEGVKEARLLLAGNGVLRDFSPLPRLAEDALIQEIWEGTHPILAGHVLRALKRPASRDAFLALCAPPKGARDAAAAAASEAARSLAELLDSLGPGSADERAHDGLRACAHAWRALSLATLLRAAGGPLDPDKTFASLAAALR